MNDSIGVILSQLSNGLSCLVWSGNNLKSVGRSETENGNSRKFDYCEILGFTRLGQHSPMILVRAGNNRNGTLGTT